MPNKERVTFDSGLQPVYFQAVESNFQAEQVDDTTAMVEGQAAVYGNWFTVAEMRGYEIQRRNNAGMFQRALAQNPDIVLRLNHEQALARTQAGTLKVWETDQDLRFQGRLNLQTTAGMDVFQNMRDGLITQGSVQYWPTVQENWTEENEDKMVDYQDIFEGRIDKGDVSVVLWGANPQCATNLSQMAQMTGSPGVLIQPSVEDVEKAVEEIQVVIKTVTEQAQAVAEPEREPAARPKINLDGVARKRQAVILDFNKQLSTHPVTAFLQDGAERQLEDRTQTSPTEVAEGVSAGKKHPNLLEEEKPDGNKNHCQQRPSDCRRCRSPRTGSHGHPGVA